MFGSYFVAGPLKLTYDCFQFAGTVILSAYLKDAQAFGDSETATVDRAYLYARLIFATYMCGTFILAQV